MKIQLSDHFSYKRLLRFVAPSILMLLCTSVYSIVDGFFVSNYVGKTPFAALNLVMPVLIGCGNPWIHGRYRRKRRGLHDAGRREKGTG